ncbi:MAG TPA: hypothetical protein VJ644_10935, partial [Jiangellaceae bacterium]|nr:hypothetical protein [Jiangellaceae bacterium]
MLPRYARLQQSFAGSAGWRCPPEHQTTPRSHWSWDSAGWPFLSLQAVEWLGMGLSREADDVRLDAIRDAYLAEWGDPWALHPVAHAACAWPASAVRSRGAAH